MRFFFYSFTLANNHLIDVSNRKEYKNSNHIYLNDKPPKKIMTKFYVAPSKTGIESLTSREIEIMRLVCIGKLNKEIADELFVSVETIKKHCQNIFLKLNARNRISAVMTFCGQMAS